MVRFHFSFEEMGGGKETLHHSCPLSRSSSPGICQKKTLSPANFCPCCRTDTKSREAAKPSSAAIPRHPMAQDQLGGGESHATSPALHLSLASCKKHYGIYGVIPTMSAAGLSAETASGLCWSSHAPQNTASPSFFPRHGLGSHKVK